MQVPVDQAALEIARSLLCLTIPLDEALKNKAQKIVLENVARRHMQRREQICFKKLQANDQEEYS
jgi:hypothetical protein